MDKEKSKKTSRVILIGCLSPILLIIVLGIIIASCTNSKNEKVDKNAPVTTQVTTIVNNELGKKVEDKKSVKSVKFDKGIVYIDVNTNANEGSKRTLLKNAAHIIEPISKIKGVEVIQLRFFAPLTDQYGKQTNEKVMFINMNRETLDKIDWKNFNYENIPDVANIYDQHKSMKNQ